MTKLFFGDRSRGWRQIICHFPFASRIAKIGPFVLALPRSPWQIWHFRARWINGKLLCTAGHSPLYVGSLILAKHQFLWSAVCMTSLMFSTFVLFIRCCAIKHVIDWLTDWLIDWMMWFGKSVPETWVMVTRSASQPCSHPTSAAKDVVTLTTRLWRKPAATELRESYEYTTSYTMLT